MASDHLWQGWPVELCSELGYDWGKCIFSNIYLSLIPNLVAFQKSSLFELKTFQKFPLTIETNQEFNESKKRLQVIQ